MGSSEPGFMTICVNSTSTAGKQDRTGRDGFTALCTQCSQFVGMSLAYSTVARCPSSAGSDANGNGKHISKEIEYLKLELSKARTEAAKQREVALEKARELD